MRRRVLEADGVENIDVYHTMYNHVRGAKSKKNRWADVSTFEKDH